MTVAAAALGNAFLQIGLRLFVEGNCPSATAVAKQLRPLLPQTATAMGISARIEPLDELLRVEVRSETGALLTVRDLSRTAPCPALAAAAAVVIASAVASQPQALPESAPPTVPLPILPPPPPIPSAVHPAPAVLWEVGIGALLVMTGQALTGGVTLETQLASARRDDHLGRLGLRLAFSAAGLRRMELADVAGAANWTRIQFLCAPRYRLFSLRPLIELYTGISAAAVLVSGQGFVASYRSQAADFGLAFGVRVGYGKPRFALWGELGVVGWLRAQELSLVEKPALARLPAWDIILSTGLSLGRLQKPGR